MGFDGVLVIDKPTGPTSHDVVASVRRMIGIRKVGHLGTLDPLATGVLPLVVGRATRLASLMTGADKVYDAWIRLGVETDTYDVTGTVVGAPAAAGAPPSPEVIADTLQRFVGRTEQRPPLVSAKKIGGVRAYELARRRQPAELPAVPVVLERLEVLAVDGWRVRCRIRCSSGYYVRSLAHDLGRRLECGGCLETLRREGHGRFALSQAIPLDEVVGAEREEAAARRARLAPRLVPLDALLPELPAVVANDGGAQRVAHGNPLRVADVAPAANRPAPTGARVRILDMRGRLLAIGTAGPGGLVQPRTVLAARGGVQSGSFGVGSVG